MLPGLNKKASTLTSIPVEKCSALSRSTPPAGGSKKRCSSGRAASAEEKKRKKERKGTRDYSSGSQPSASASGFLSRLRFGIYNSCILGSCSLQQDRYHAADSANRSRRPHDITHLLLLLFLHLLDADAAAASPCGFYAPRNSRNVTLKTRLFLLPSGSLANLARG